MPFYLVFSKANRQLVWKGSVNSFPFLINKKIRYQEKLREDCAARLKNYKLIDKVFFNFLNFYKQFMQQDV
jgi:hypothetical protein